MDSTSTKPKKFRLDELLVLKSLAETRSQAKALILAGKVRLDTRRLDKPGHQFPVDTPIHLDKPSRFVSRGGEKLEEFLDKFDIHVNGLRHLDIGASTGGFTDCCLQRGSISATCLDVGRAQLHSKLLSDERVINMEKTNARHLKPGDLPFDNYPLIVIDVSFISLTKILPAAWQFLEPSGKLIALVKPQFEAERHEVDAGNGIIRDEKVHSRILANIKDFTLSQLQNSKLIGTIASPINGTDGNREFLIGLSKMR